MDLSPASSTLQVPGGLTELQHASLRQILTSLGHHNWRAGQLSAITALINNKDVFCAFPPGFGKSLVYQVAGLYRTMNQKGITFIVTPLVSLMRDQVAELLKFDIYAFSIYHGQNQHIQKQYLYEITCSTHPPTFVFVSPERLSWPQWKDAIDMLHHTRRLNMFVFDEAQVILEWGQTFRPSYMDFKGLKTRYPDVPILALSGSMSPNMMKGYCDFLEIDKCHLIQKYPERANIFYKVIPVNPGEVQDKLREYIEMQNSSDCGIVYCRTPKHCKQYQEKLREAGITAVTYHGGMTEDERSMAYQLWKDNMCNLVIATVAFGMGINKEDVRFVVHADLPKNLSAFIQETGRAGRDGKQAECILLFDFQDCYKNYSLALEDNSPPNPDLFDRIISASHQLLKMTLSLSTCRRVFILAHYGHNVPNTPCGNCDNCIDPLPQSKTLRVKRAFLRELILCFRRLAMEVSTGVTVSNLATSFVQTMQHAPFKDVLHIADEQVRAISRREDRERICKRAIQNMIVQGVFVEYPIKTLHHNFYLKLGDTELFQNDFMIPI